MFGRKNQQWLVKAQAAEQPLPLREMTPRGRSDEIATFLRSKIGTKEIYGFVSVDDELFIPTRFLQRLISRELATKGFVDICDLIDITNLPGKLLERQIVLNVQDVEGFFDVIPRKFFTLRGAMSEIKQKLGTTTAIDLKFLLNQLYWTEDHLEGILDFMAQNNQFIGYIDPLKQRIYNLTSLNFDSSADEKKNVQFLVRFMNTSFQLESEVALIHVSKLTKLPKDECLELLERHRSEINFIFSSNYEYLYLTLNIINQVLKDIFVYQSIPIEFWLHRLDVDRADFINLLNVLNQSLEGTLTSEDFIAPSLNDWFENGIDIEGLALKLNLYPLQLLDQIQKLAKLLRLRLIAGEFSNPFLVKGVRHFNIFCQVDTSDYTDPHLYFECQNCRRVMCSNCRSTGSKHECPFCGNISAFIIDLPRFCPHCKVNYTHSFNLTDTEECYFCKKGPLKMGWTEYEPIALETLQLDPRLSEFFDQTVETDIPLKRIISLSNYSDSDTIELLEQYILHGTIQGKINIRDLTFQLKKRQVGFLCGVCELPRSNTISFSCMSCAKKVCSECYEEISAVGMAFCPECGGNLTEET
ncbi:MAG: hypothetical protein JSV04_13075 [Candidatus Heimdallarchaeota archaeon]|nr:MAG: hypothetical protein JSV04_13075 [Candidatus Heimdallarchaeota archaeon]